MEDKSKETSLSVDSQESQNVQKKNPKSYYRSSIGIFYALIVLVGNGIHPIINNARPADFDSLIFTWMMAMWELVCVIPFLIIERKKRNYIKQNPTNPAQIKNSRPHSSVIIRLIIIGIIFSFATYGYIEGLTMAGSISGSIALKTSPIYAMIIGAMFLNEKIKTIHIVLTGYMLIGLYYLATLGTFQIEAFSIGFGILLIVPLLWGIGHAIAKQLLMKKLVTTLEVITIRTFIVFITLFFVSLGVNGWIRIKTIFQSPIHVGFSFLMGSIYFCMHFAWYKSITNMDLGFASALVIPSPAITAILSILFLHDKIYSYHIIGMLVMFSGLYAMIVFQKREQKKKESDLKNSKNK